MSLPVHRATRYMVPLREGGSLPALLETESGDFFVTKFRGAGQGARALIAELLSGLLAQHLGLPVPDLGLIDLHDAFGRTERDPEIQDILKGSRGLNVGMRYLEGAFNYDPVGAADLVPPGWAAEVVWFDAFTTNIDRTARNPNLMVWNEKVYLIDHGASLYFHHNWEGMDESRMRTPFPPIKDHVLLPLAGDLEAADRRIIERLDKAVLREVVDGLPDVLLMDAPEGRVPPFHSAEENRAAYLDYFLCRLEGERAFVQEAVAAQARQRAEPPQPLRYRR